MLKRLQNILLMLVSLAFSLVRGNGRKQVDPQRFVIVHPTTNLGDMVCITPLFEAVKKHNPTAWLTVIGSPGNRSLLEYNPHVDEYIDTSISLWHQIKHFRTHRFDVGVLINPDPRYLSALFLGDVGAISCFVLTREYEDRESRPYRILAQLMHKVEYYPGKYVPDQYMKLLEPYGIQEDAMDKSLFFSPQTKLKILEKLQEAGIQQEKIIAIAPGAGSDIKRWPAERFALVANELYKNYKTPVLVIGGPKDSSVVTEMLRYLDSEVLYLSPGPQQIDELKATLSCVHLVIGNDSGAIHIGEAVGVKTLTIAGITDVHEHMKEYDGHRIVNGPSSNMLYRAYIGDETKIDPNYARKQMESVSIHSVISTASELLETPSRTAGSV